MGIVSGTIREEYFGTMTGEIGIDVFKVRLSELKREGFESGDAFIKYVMNADPNEVVAYGSDEDYRLKDITAYSFQRRDGYNTLLKVDGNLYTYF